MRHLPLFLAAAAVAFMPAFGFAEEATLAPKTFSDADKAAIEDIIKDYITNKHPEVIAQAIQALQKRDQDSAEAKSKEAVTTQKDRLFNDPNSPIAGNPKGDVTVVEFFDFQCGYCKMSEPSLEKLISEDKNVRLIYKDFPILGPASTSASKAALASVRQGKYIKFHDALLAKKDHLSDDGIYEVAKEVGLDVEKLKKDAADADIAKIIDANLKLGNDVGVRGTPMFIIGDQVFPGAIQYDQMKKAVDDARAALKK